MGRTVDYEVVLAGEDAERVWSWAAAMRGEREASLKELMAQAAVQVALLIRGTEPDLPGMEAAPERPITLEEMNGWREGKEYGPWRRSEHVKKALGQRNHAQTAMPGGLISVYILRSSPWIPTTKKTTFVVRFCRDD